ncbi:hypothetical protein BCR36DRAFT_275390 [Piromyces finnis]|uniref:Uncharacterized protein n=1 Tax=Piromyces finnis TaxID=1754191 RepID=A0A1Y1VLD8_9FUNG|nr:hypothetical protein BCR36DRAFT_275390 [Piromyces finnis]|eukprot:ORX59281.1 hypothetical protein BCR36DRAFT_275390 [Piromyces finnis]
MSETEQNKNVTEYILSTLSPIQRYDVLTALQEVTKESEKYNNEEISNYMLNKFQYIYITNKQKCDVILKKILNAKEEYIKSLTTLLELRYKMATNIITIEEKAQQIKEKKLFLKNNENIKILSCPVIMLISLIVLLFALPDIFIKLFY